jgi:hypothetical protein
MTRIRVAVIAPRIDAAAIRSGAMPHPTYAAMAAATQAMGMVRVAGWYNPTIRTAMIESGNSANRASPRSAIGITPIRRGPVTVEDPGSVIVVAHADPIFMPA